MVQMQVWCGMLKSWYNRRPKSNIFISTQAAINRLMSDVTYGVLLYGGLDSSLPAFATALHLAGTKAAKRWDPQLYSFALILRARRPSRWEKRWQSIWERCTTSSISRCKTGLMQ